MTSTPGSALKRERTVSSERFHSFAISGIWKCCSTAFCGSDTPIGIDLDCGLWVFRSSDPACGWPVDDAAEAVQSSCPWVANPRWSSFPNALARFPKLTRGKICQSAGGPQTGSKGGVDLHVLPCLHVCVSPKTSTNTLSQSSSVLSILE